jgi:hypothetical protein
MHYVELHFIFIVDSVSSWRAWDTQMRQSVPVEQRAVGPFSSQPSGPWPVGRFFVRLGGSSSINSDMLVARALKNSQLIRQRPDESHVIYGTGHEPK